MPKYWMIGSGVALGVLLIAAIAIALLRDAVVLPEGSPERTVQIYLEAISDDDIEAARAMLSSEFRERCTLEQMFSRSFGRQSLEDSRVTYDKTNLVEDKAFVVFEVTQTSNSGPFGIDEFTRDEQYTLVRDEGEWRLSASSWPYHSCAQPIRVPVEQQTRVRAPEPVPATSTDTAR